MNTQNSTITKLAETALMAALCYVSFTFLQIKIPVPGGDATSIHIGNAFCVLAALLIGGVYGGLSGAIGMGIADLMDPVYITGAPKTFILKFCIGLITGLVAHKIAKINESTDKKYVFKWSVIASVAGLAFNVVADPIVGYFYRQYILGQPQELAQALAKMRFQPYFHSPENVSRPHGKLLLLFPAHLLEFPLHDADHQSHQSL